MGKAGKTERGRKTRARIVTAATTRFCEQGYLDTTMAAIATDAGVAVQTLYLAFGSKVAILAAAHDVAVVGDDEPLPVLERPWMAAIRTEPDGGRALELVMTNGLQIVERVSPIYGVIQAAAADADVAELLAATKAQRLATMRSFAEELVAKDGYAPGVSADWAADVLYAVISDELYRLLVLERHWPSQDWKAWAHDSAARRLFPDSMRTTDETRPPPARKTRQTGITRR